MVIDDTINVNDQFSHLSAFLFWHNKNGDIKRLTTILKHN